MAGDEITCPTSPTVRVVIGNGFACGSEPSGRGIVTDGAGIGEGGEDFVGGVIESGEGRVGLGQVDDVRAFGSLLIEQSS